MKLRVTQAGRKTPKMYAYVNVNIIITPTKFLIDFAWEQSNDIGLIRT